MAQPAPPSAVPPPPASNGVLTAPATVNKKKQKRRAKLAARQASEQGLAVNGQQQQPAPMPAPVAGHHHHAHPHPHQHHVPHAAHTHSPYPEQDYADDLDETSEEDDDHAYSAHVHHAQNGHYLPEEPEVPQSKNKKKKKKKRGAAAGPDYAYNADSHALSLPSLQTLRNYGQDTRAPGRNQKQDRIWNTSTHEERERIKEFWLSLSEQERKSLLKIEKTAVLNKMKEQQKHSCSCTVCGRKRTAIEEELEVLYDAYYEELAQYANQPNRDPTELVEQTRMSLPYHHPEALPPRPLNSVHHGQVTQHRTSRVHELIDDNDELSDEDEPYSDEDDESYSDEEDYESDMAMPPNMGGGFFDFGNNLTVKDGILTVADDLLKNDGRKFIEMMEQLAERRMQREHDVEYASQQPSHSHSHGEPPLDDDDDYDEEDDGYDSQDDYDDEEEEDDMVGVGSAYGSNSQTDGQQGGMTEEQRMEEGRRMFQIFAARMFEQRVLTAYREKVALERQSKLLEELEEEDKAKTQKDAKKARDAEKKKNKKAAQKQAKAEEKAKKDAEKAAEEAAAKAAEEKRLEEQRKKKEEQKRKKEAEKKAQEEERLRKEAEKAKRQQEERERQAEAERKAREAKAQEKRLRDEQRKKEREEREAREKEAREQKAHDEKQRRDQEARAKLPAITPQIIKRPSQPSQPAVPPALTAQKSSSGMSSPHIAVATPVIPKAVTPGTRTRQSSEHESMPSAKFAEQTGAINKTKTPPTADTPVNIAPRTILQNPNKQQQQRPSISLPQPTSHQSLPPTAQTPFQAAFGSMGPFSPYAGAQSPMMQRSAGPFPTQPPSSQFRPFQSGPAPTATNGFVPMQQERSFSGEAPPGFQAVPGLGHAPGFPSSRPAGGHHSRQSSTTEIETSPATLAQPISRPAPIQRPSSVRPSIDGAAEIDDLSAHLGSRALLDDVDDALPVEPRRTSNPLGAPRTGFSPHFQAAPGFAPSPSSWAAPHAFPTQWSNSWAAAPRPSAGPRPRALRQAVCTACRTLGPDFHDVARVLAALDRSALDHPPSLAEVADICDTEGDALNGGGTLHVRRLGQGFAIRYEADNGPVRGLGEIGSPVVGNSHPAAGFGRGFGAIGGVGSPGGF